MRNALVTLTFAALLCTPAVAAEKPRQLGDLGQVGDVHLATSCDPALQKEFDRGLALLHSFFYDEARRVFSAIAEKDPECAMAHWGVAMSYYHPLWTAPDSADLLAGDVAAGRALDAKKQNPREAEYVRAVAAYYRGPFDAAGGVAVGAPSCHGGAVTDPRGRAKAFHREMEKVSAAHPDDVDAAAFHALSLIATAPPGDPELRNPRRAAEILEAWYAKRPKHPGLIHYMIHAYDYPQLAAKGLPAAKAYASLAPWVPHALHMPSHIFTRLGMWNESIATNLSSAGASRAYAAKYFPGAAMQEELHANDYAMYGYLQTGQDAKAKDLLAQLGKVTKTWPVVDFATGYAFGAMPARYALERRQWKEAAALEIRPMPFWSRLPFAEGHIAYARAIGAARSGDLERAHAAAARLGELAAASTEPRFAYFADQMNLQREAALGWIAIAEGSKDEGIAILRRAAASEDSLGKHPVSPGAMFPIRELLGDALVETGKPAEALVEFEASLKINPGRFNALYGAANAAKLAGKADLARKYYKQLGTLAAAGDGTRAELIEARRTAGD
jgi:tetratricopeptide (TPR) repeat protein